MKHSVLTRRAVLLTAIVAISTVAVMAFAGVFMLHSHNNASARAHALSQAQLLAPCAENYISGKRDALEVQAELLLSQGADVYLVDEDGLVIARWAQADSPAEAALKLCAFDADTAFAASVKGGTAMAAHALSGGGSLIICLDKPGMPFLKVILLPALLAVIISALLLKKLTDSMILPAVWPISQLRNVAVKVAGGDLEARADDTVQGELGELGQAINNMSYQLSRSMYTLIVERNRLKYMIDGLSEGIVAVNAKGHITHRNPALKAIFPKGNSGYGRDSRLKVIDNAEIWEDFDTVIRTGKPVIRTMNVRDMIVRITITPIVDELRIISGAVGLFSDITQQERLEITRREYVANVSHEMRTPLTAMRALIEPLKEGMVNTEEARQRYYDIILREILRLSRLINDQLELSRLQSGTLAIEKSVFKLDELVLDVCDRYSAIAEDHGLTFTLDTDFEPCPPVFANADRLEQMLIILLDNAIKYTENGGSVGVSGRWDETCAVITVSDTGVGISETDLPHVFDRFYKVDKAHSGKGSGLGLSIAKELQKRMGEDVWVESEAGKGSRFSFTVHLYKSQAEEV